MAIDTTLELEEDIRGLTTTGFIRMSNGISGDSIAYLKAQKFLTVLNEEVISVQIDSIQINTSWLFSQNSKYQLGYETVVDLANFKRGAHTLQVQRKTVRNDSIVTSHVGIIPFWYYPD